MLAIHRAVWNYFFGDIPSNCVIHHVDTDKDNNDITNLAMMTRREHNRLHLDLHPLALEAFMEAHRERLENITFSIDAPTIEIIDSEHQRFNGMTFYKKSGRGHYHHKLSIQRAVWAFYNGNIPDDEGYHVHHIDENTNHNDIENLSLITRSEHGKIHAPQFIEANKKRAQLRRELRSTEELYETRECVICHAEFRALKNSDTKTCSRNCARILQWNWQKSDENLIEKVCENCGKTFKTPFNKTRFCCHKCARQLRTKLARQSNSLPSLE